MWMPTEAWLATAEKHYRDSLRPGDKGVAAEMAGLLQRTFWSHLKPGSAKTKIYRCIQPPADAEKAELLKTAEYLALIRAGLARPDLLIWVLETMGYEIRKRAPSEVTWEHLQGLGRKLDALAAGLHDAQQQIEDLTDDMRSREDVNLHLSERGF